MNTHTAVPANQPQVLRDANGPAIRLPLDGSLGLEAMDRAIIEAVLIRLHYNVAATARALKTTRDTLRYRIRKYGIRVEGED